MEHPLALLATYGYPLVFLGTLLEGEVIMVLAGLAVYEGYLSFPLVVLVGLVGGVLGDQLFFLFGRMKGQQWIAAHPRWEAKANVLHDRLEKHRDWMVFASRFLYGFRMTLPVLIGTGSMPARRFLLLNIAGAIPWAIGFASLGYLFGGAAETILGNIRRIEGTLALVILGVILVGQIIVRRATRAEIP